MNDKRRAVVLVGGGSRKTRYASLLVRAVDLARVPRPLELVLAHV